MTAMMVVSLETLLTLNHLPQSGVDVEHTADNEYQELTEGTALDNNKFINDIQLLILLMAPDTPIETDETLHEIHFDCCDEQNTG
jgi:hypothetical protein